MPTVFGVQPMPTASFMKYTNEAATDKEVDTVLKIKQEKDKDELKRQELLLKGMKSVQDVITAQDSVFNLKPYTAFQQEQSKVATGHVNDYINRVKSMGESGEMDAVELAQAQLELSQKLNDPNIKTFIRESTELTKLQDEVFKDKKGIYDPDATSEYFAELAPINTPLDKIDYTRPINVPLDETVETIVKSNIHEGSNVIQDLTNPFGKLADVSYEIMNASAIKDSIISKANASPSFRNKILKTGKTVEQYAEDVVKTRVAGYEEMPNNPGIYRRQKDAKFTEVSPEKDPNSTAKKASDGSTTKQTAIDVSKDYDKFADNSLFNTTQDNPGKSVNPPIKVNYYASLNDNQADIESKIKEVEKELSSFMALPLDSSGTQRYGRIEVVNGKKQYITDPVSGTPIDYSKEYYSLKNGSDLQYTQKGNLERTKREIDADVESKYPGYTQYRAKFEKENSYEDFKALNEGYGVPVNRAKYDEYVTKKMKSSGKSSYGEAEKYREDITRNKMGANSYSPVLIKPDTKDYDYTQIISPFKSGHHLVSVDATVIDANSNKLSAQQIEKLKDTDFEIEGIVQDPYSGKYMYKLTSYTPAVNKQGGKVPNSDSTSKDRRTFEAASMGESFYVSNDKLQELMFNTQAGGDTPEKAAEWVKVQTTAMFGQIEKTGVAYYGPGQLDEKEVNIKKNSSNPSLFDIYTKDGDYTVVNSYTLQELTTAFNFYRDKKILSNIEAAKRTAAIGESPARMDDDTKKALLTPSNVGKNLYVYNDVNSTYALMAKGEGHDDGTPNPNSSGDKYGTTGEIQVSRSWEKFITGQAAFPSTGKVKQYAKTWADFEASPALQKQFYNDILKPDADAGIKNVKQNINQEWSKKFFRNLEADLRRLGTNVNFLIETEQGTHIDEDLLRYAMHNIGSRDFANFMRVGKVSSNSNPKKPGKLEQLAEGLPKIDKFRKSDENVYLVSGINYLVRPPQGNQEELINYKHIPTLNDFLKEDKRLVLSDGFRVKAEKPGAKHSKHKEGKAYDFSLRNYGIEVDANKDKNGANKAALQAEVNKMFPPNSLPPNIERFEVHQFPPDPEKAPNVLGNYHIHVEFKN